MSTKKEFLFDLFGKPKLCVGCDRLCFLRCFCCDTIYCSGECQLKDWTIHHGIAEEIADQDVQMDNHETPTVKEKRQEAPVKKVEVSKIVEKEQNIADKKNDKDLTLKKVDKGIQPQRVFSRESFFKGDPNSLTYKLMEPYFPENVKKGVKISVQGRLAKALQKSEEKTVFESIPSVDVNQLHANDVRRELEYAKSYLKQVQSGAITKKFTKSAHSKLNDDKENEATHHCLSFDDIL